MFGISTVTDESALKGWKILVVDDEPDQLVFISTILEDHGATIVKANDGDEALDLARKENPHLITLDLAMPGKDGIEVFTILRNDHSLREIPVCIITGKPEMRKLIYEKTGITKPEGYLDKPVNEDILLKGVRKILEVKDRKQKKGAEA
jgi:CheY-like chemotaxis protein